MPDLLRRACDEAIRFTSGLADRRVNGSRFVPPPVHMPEHGVGAAAALEAFLDGYGSWLTASAGPRYFGFVTGGCTPAAERPLSDRRLALMAAETAAPVADRRDTTSPPPACLPTARR